MGKFEISSKYVIVWCLLCSISIVLNLLWAWKGFTVGGGERELSWSRRAAAEAEIVASITCSGHGRAYLDGLLVDGQPVCECNTCYEGPDCSHFSSACVADVGSGNPMFLEPFWMKHAAESAIMVAGWHRMGYSYTDNTGISQELKKQIHKLHRVVGNAITDNRFMVFGAGSTQLLIAAVYALSSHNSTSPARIVASVPFYPVYELQPELFRSMDFKFEGDTSMWRNASDMDMNFIEFVTSPNNPDGLLKKELLTGSFVKTIHDHAYYWPHFSPITAPANEDVMIFTMSKLTGHAGSRFGWALIKDEGVYEKMYRFLELNSMGVSRDTQLRALKLLQLVLDGDGKELHEFGYETMRKRWEQLKITFSVSTRFSLQQTAPQYCTFFQKAREASPAYAWVTCEREEDKDCYAVLKAKRNQRPFRCEVSC